MDEGDGSHGSHLVAGNYETITDQTGQERTNRVCLQVKQSQDKYR